jgi:hypothetical protein
VTVGLNQIGLFYEDGTRLPFIYSSDPVPRAFEGRAELARLRVFPLLSSGTRPFEMKVEHELTYDIAFDQLPPGYGEGLLDVLQLMREAVKLVVANFESEFA